jgi:hypothetical protein
MTSADEYRRRAAAVGQKLGRRPNKGTRAMLKNKRCGLLEQAENQDWLDGKSGLAAAATRADLPKDKSGS